jgi:murein DD-endopeptidase MepM/ murein hydrolase activator NlpD
LHDDGYYDFERGTFMGAESRGCPTEDDLKGQGPGGVDMKIIYSYHLQLTYTDGLGQPRTRIMAFEFGDANKTLRGPIVFPPNIDPAAPATLYISKVVTTCVVDPNLPEIPQYNAEDGSFGSPEPQWDCSDQMLLEFDDPTVFVRQPGYFCDTDYDDTIFTLEDDEPSTWEPASVDRLVLSDGLPTPVTFAAIGPKLVNGQPLAGSAIGFNEPFAIYGNFSGKTFDSGLSFPYITGTRNGQPFAYTCGGPDLIRDGLETIVQIGPPPEGACAFYRLPYPNGTSVPVNQGNGGTTSHNVGESQEWALDLDGDEGDPLIAARGGEVARVVNGITLSCGGCGPEPFIQLPCPPGCPAYGNHVAIQHQGGDVSWYMHLVSSGLQVGNRVKRGDPIGLLGNTGRSTGPHLHFQATASVLDSNDKVNWQTVPIRYEIDGFCEVPTEGQTYVSTNEPN